MMVEYTAYRVVVAGHDITSNLRPKLLDLSISLTSNAVSDTASITLDDSGGMLRLPRDGDLAVIYLGGVERFRGKVNDVGSSGDRGGGRQLKIGFSGIGAKGKAKEPKFKHYDGKTLDEVMTAAGKAAGLSGVKVDPDLGSILLDYAGQFGESFIHFGHRLAIAHGATFKVMGDRAVFVKRNAGRSASGKPLTPIIAKWGVNLLDWDVVPLVGRPRFKATTVRYYDRDKAKWEQEQADTSDLDTESVLTERFAVSGKTEAKSRASSSSGESDREAGSGTVTILGSAAAQPEAPISLVGTRAGVDGSYIIDSVSETFSRGSGYTSALTIKKPGGGAGKDNR